MIRSYAAARGGDGGEPVHAECLPAQPGVDARLPENLLGRGGRARPAGQRGPQRLAPLRERRVDHGEHLLPSRAGRRSGWRSNATSPESTLGTGQNTDLGTEPALRAVAYQASLTDGMPYTRLPGPATIRSATSAWTMTRPPRSVLTVASRCSTTGTATL